jgi:hypothetical protein
MTSKYRSCLFALAVVMAACMPQAVAPSPTQTARPTAAPTATTALPALVPAKVEFVRRWHLVPSPLRVDFHDENVHVTVTFARDPADGAPRARLRTTGQDIPLQRTGPLTYVGAIDPAGIAPGEQPIDAFVLVLGQGYVLAGSGTFLLSQPQYVVWTLDFEGDASADPELANTAAIADGLRVPMALYWNPRVWTTSQVSAERQDAMLKWTKERAIKGDEVALHIHPWTDYVRAAGLVAKTMPSWAGRGDGYDVPITAYTETDQKTLIDYGVKLMTDHGLSKPTSFRAGGDMADATTLRALAASGFDLDCTAVAKDYPSIGRIPYPWNLPVGVQPYRPSRTDANAVGDLPLLEAPTIGGNTYAFTVNSIQPQIRANLAVFAPPGKVATERKAITIVSHPGTIVPAERAAIEALLGAFDNLRYDKDAGPVRFVTTAQLAKAYR